MYIYIYIYVTPTLLRKVPGPARWNRDPSRISCATSGPLRASCIFSDNRRNMRSTFGVVVFFGSSSKHAVDVRSRCVFQIIVATCGRRSESLCFCFRIIVETWSTPANKKLVSTPPCFGDERRAIPVTIILSSFLLHIFPRHGLVGWVGGCPKGAAFWPPEQTSRGRGGPGGECGPGPS